jgi:hypothetical protein
VILHDVFEPVFAVLFMQKPLTAVICQYIYQRMNEGDLYTVILAFTYMNPSINQIAHEEHHLWPI